MTTELTNEEIARVFAMYLYSRIKFSIKLMNDEGTEVEKIKTSEKPVHIFFPEYLKVKNYFSDCKLLLTPLQDITDEDAIEVATQNGFKSFQEVNGRALIKDFFTPGPTLFHLHPMNITASYQYLVNKGYSVPLFFSLGHWANGKTAIELGLAINKNKQS